MYLAGKELLSVNENTIPRLQAAELSILRKIAGICNKPLRLFAVCGTLLGALRHGGFIPWDDDIDIAVPEEDMPALLDGAKALGLTVTDCGYKYKIGQPGTLALEKTDFQKLFTEMLTDTIPNIAVDILPIKPLSDTLKTAHKRTESLVSVGRKVVDSIHFTGDYKKCRFADLELLLPNRYDKLLETLYPEGTAVPEKPPLMSERKKGHCAYFSDSFGIADIAPPLLHRYIDVFEGLTKENPMGVYLFGAGDSSRIFKERYNKLCNIVTLFDNDPKKWGTIVNGLPVKSPEELPEILKNSPGRLIIASIYAIEIADGLERMGINDFYIFRDGFQY